MTIANNLRLIQRLKARRLEEAEKEKAAAAAAAAPPAEPAEPIQSTTTTTTSTPEVRIVSKHTNFVTRTTTAICGFFVSLLWGIPAWWQAKVTDPFNRFLNDEQVNDCLDEICVFFGERAVFVFLVAFSLLPMIIIYSYKMVNWCLDSAVNLWEGGLDGVRSRFSHGPQDYHRSREQLPPWMTTSAGINQEEDHRHEKNVGMNAGAYHEAYHHHDQYTGTRAGSDLWGCYRRDERSACHMGTRARMGKEQYYSAWAQHQR